ncbi:hypothetical protein WCP94_000274 (plasmid) [Bilophila wadsworthia]
MAWGRFRERGMDTSKGRGGRRVRMRYMAHGERQTVSGLIGISDGNEKDFI